MFAYLLNVQTLSTASTYRVMKLQRARSIFDILDNLLGIRFDSDKAMPTLEVGSVEKWAGQYLRWRLRRGRPQSRAAETYTSKSYILREMSVIYSGAY